MSWYWFALIAGLAAPWVIQPKAVLAGFGSGFQTGFGAWLGMTYLTIPLMFVIMWIVHMLGLI